MDDVTDPTTVVTPMRKRRRAAAPPPPSSALQHRVQRAAKIVAKHQKVLGDVGMEALKVATLQIVARKVEELRIEISQQFTEISSLLESAGFSSQEAALIQNFTGLTKAPVTKINYSSPSCALCGRPGVYQSKSARVEKGAQKPWYCQGEHAHWAQMEDGEAAQQARITPSAGAPNIEAALKALNG